MSNEAESKYVEIADSLARQIRQGEYEPGERLPSYVDMAQEQRVSDKTIERAVSLLVQQGLVRTVRRQGAFVAAAHVHSTSTKDWYRRSAAQKFHAGRERWETVGAGTADPDEIPADVARDLELAEDEPAAWRDRRLLDAGEVTQWHRAWWQGRVLEDAPELADPSPIPGGTTKLLEERTGRRATRGKDRMRARGATADDAEHLGIDRGHCVLELWHRLWDQSGVPLLLEVTAYPPLHWCSQDEYALD